MHNQLMLGRVSLCFSTQWHNKIAQWIRLRLPSFRPGFKSQAHHLRFFQFILFKYLSFELECEKNENKQKEAGIGPFFK